MKLKLTFLVVLILISVVAHCANPDPQVKKNTHDDLGSETTTNSDQKVNRNEKSSESGSNLESNPVDPELLKKENVPNEIQNANVGKTMNVPNKQSGNKESGNIQKGSKDKDLVDNKSKTDVTDEGSGSNDVPKEENLSSLKKGSFRGEQCDSSFKCTIGNGENHGMIACLSVPGDESTEVSLLIQNKGKGVLDVDINAPDFVRLEKTKIQIQENDDEKVKVSMGGNGITGKFITLKTNEGSCNLDLIDFRTHNPMKKSNYISQLTYTNFFKRTPFLGLLSLAFILVIVSVVVCVTYQKRRFVINGPKYQKLDVISSI